MCATLKNGLHMMRRYRRLPSIKHDNYDRTAIFSYLHDRNNNIRFFAVIQNVRKTERTGKKGTRNRRRLLCNFSPSLLKNDYVFTLDNPTTRSSVSDGRLQLFSLPAGVSASTNRLINFTPNGCLSVGSTNSCNLTTRHKPCSSSLAGFPARARFRRFSRSWIAAPIMDATRPQERRSPKTAFSERLWRRGNGRERRTLEMAVERGSVLGAFGPFAFVVSLTVISPKRICCRRKEAERECFGSASEGRRGGSVN